MYETCWKKNLLQNSVAGNSEHFFSTGLFMTLLSAYEFLFKMQDSSTQNTSRCLSLTRKFRQIKYLLECNKTTLLILTLVFAYGKYLYSMKDMHQPSSQLQDLEKFTKQKSQVSNPSLVTLVTEREAIFKERRRILEEFCTNTTHDSPLYKPRDGTIYFDILWHPHYQVLLE